MNPLLLVACTVDLMLFALPKASCAAVVPGDDRPGPAPRQAKPARPAPRPAAPVRIPTPVPEQAPRNPHPAAVRQSISLQFAGSNLRDVVQAVARYSGLEVALTPGAKGLVSLTLKDRSPRLALQMVAASAGMVAQDIGGVWVVGPLDEVRAMGGRVGEPDWVALRHL
ncbi:MAG: hypothetical protein ACOVT5_00320, partial [Armatimonadaceae bacterium]